MRRCARCNTPLPVEARFCWNCGSEQPLRDPRTGGAPTRINLDGDVEAQLNEQFFHALRARVEQEHDPELFTDFSERLYTSGFRDTVVRRIVQLASLLAEMRDAGEAWPQEVNTLIEDLFEDLMDQFIIRFAPDLCEVTYPEAMLKYQYADAAKVSLTQMILDFLQPDSEGEDFYTDFVRMPVEKLTHAGKSFLFPAKDEKILLIVDQSVLGTCKEGYAFTDRALYWKAPFQKPRYAAYTQLREYRKEKSWIAINGHFFNSTPAINLRLLRLLSRLQRLFY